MNVVPETPDICHNVPSRGDTPRLPEGSATMNATTSTTTTSSKPVFEHWFVYGDDLGDHELWASYHSEKDMRRDCAHAIALNYEGTEVEEDERCISIIHNYFEII